MEILKHVTKEFLALWLTIDAFISLVDLMNFLALLNSTYEPTTIGAVIYCTQIILYLVRNAFLSAIIAAPLNWLLKKIGIRI